MFKSKLRLLFFLFIFTVANLTLIFTTNKAEAVEEKNSNHSPSCSCEDKRVLSYQIPNLSGEDVEDLQLALSALGYYEGKVDGIYGPMTLDAVIRFQKDNDLPILGEVDLKTWQTLSDIFEEVEVSKEEIAPPTGELAIVIDATKRTLTIFSDGEVFKQYPCAVGKASTPSPIGNWKIKYKAKNWGTGFGTRWNGLNVDWGIYGIHGTNKPGSIGSYASHGCIRMWNKNVEELYPWVPVGTPVYIIGNPFGVYGQKNTIVNGSRGSDVLLVQKRLKQWGYLNGPADGVFGYGSEEALKKFQKDFKLRVDGQVNTEDYEALKLR